MSNLIKIICNSIVFLSLSLSLNACAQGVPKNTLQSKSIMFKNDKNHWQLNISAEEASLAALKLVASLNTIEELTPEHIQKTTGIIVNAYDRIPEEYFILGKTKHWNYIFEIRSSAIMKKDIILAFDFYKKNEVEDKEIPITEICTVNLEQYHQILLNMGFKQVNNINNDTLDRQYHRGEVEVNLLYVRESSEEVIHKCVINMWAYKY